MIRVASYCRVSTEQDDQANSFASQCRYFREYIERQSDWELYEIYADEGISGTETKKRTQFNRMINDAYDGKFQLILTKEVSRFSRNILDTIAYSRELKAIGVGVLFVTDRINTLEPESEMLLSFLASLAQEESRRTSSRVVWGQTRQMEKGVVFGRSLLGYDVKDGQITINPDGTEIVRLIFHKYAVEQMSTSKIARFLTTQAYPTSRGGTVWHANTIVKILNNEKYIGTLLQKKSFTPNFLTHEKQKNRGEVPQIRIENHHEPIISRDIWDLAQARLRAAKKESSNTTHISNRYVFSGKIRCGECGAHFVGRLKYDKNGEKIRRWRCASAVRDGADACGIGKLIRDDDAIDMLKTAIQNLQINRARIIRHVAELALSAKKNSGASFESPQKIDLEIEKIRKKRERVLDSYFSRQISAEDMINMKQKYEDQIASLSQKLDMARQAAANIKIDDIQDELESILSGKKESEVFYKMILHSLTVYKDRHMELRLNHLPLVFRFVE